ncbi:MAG: thiamine-phosphate kinase [Myxococcota bacterium]
MNAGARGEAALIEAMKARVPHLPSPDGPGDDGAIVGAGPARALTTDALIEGVHFLRAHPMGWLGHKALAVNLSDLAAMGASPEAFTVSAAVPGAMPFAAWEALSDGMGELARASGCVLAGGDVVRSPGPLMLNITAWGPLAGPRPLTRTGGEPGDLVMVAGPIGRSGAGLTEWLALTSPAADWSSAPLAAPSTALRAHLRPDPPLAAGPFALHAGAHAAMDLSDGLAIDLPRLARASGVHLVVDLDALPADPALPDASPDARVCGGEDYSLVALVSPDRASQFVDYGFAAIGHATAPAATPVSYLRAGRPTQLLTRPFIHFDTDTDAG